MTGWRQANGQVDEDSLMNGLSTQPRVVISTPMQKISHQPVEEEAFDLVVVLHMVHD